MEKLIDLLGDTGTLALSGVLVGILFGATAQKSHFCLRASTVEVAEGEFGPRLAVWLVAFTSALTLVQGFVWLEWLDLSDTRAIASTGSLSGALIGGLMFGVGMVLARGCASRLLVLASCGNLRALVTGLVLTLVAQAAYTGVLSPVREVISGLWTVSGGSGRDLSAILGLSPLAYTVLAALGWVLALMFASHRDVSAINSASAAGVGVAVALGWLMTFAIAQSSFEVVPVSSVTFTGPATDTLMALVAERNVALSFGLGLVPGVAIGAATSALLLREWKIERFGQDTPMERYLVGAVMMGFGAMLAGGCAVGAGLSGGAALSLTAWLAVFSMWVGAVSAHRLIVRIPALQRS
ncbi:YeeE/YedE family protein [Ruegeria sp. 2205SS24-7]|uniref:YeeE/YedE family protein n=1 Tax=Ruegeria discodermiae TaxID=3064389 RepID=UPI002740BE80|nr:YeeE/YedE family protein [Ruegeria sp. 2205SS24-7]MDP5218968.1 YeeE/YedE family protein [Ruegeria sp. 2205SS24-7]